MKTNFGIYPFCDAFLEISFNYSFEVLLLHFVDVHTKYQSEA